MELIEYLIKYSLFLTGMYFLWKVLSTRRPDPGFNRYFMTLAPIISGFAPFFRFHFNVFTKNAEIPYLNIPELQSVMSGFTAGTDFGRDNSFEGINYVEVAGILFIVISAIIFIHLIISLVKKINLIEQYGIINKGKIRIVPVDKKILPFSFIRYIFLNPNLYNKKSFDAIIEHEKAHVIQFHYVDIIFYELLKLVLWFHPVYWLMRKRLVESHEYLADQAVLEKGMDELDYMQLILSHTNFYTLMGPGSQFSKMITLKRLKMMNKTNKTNRLLRIAVMLPVAAIFTLILGFSPAASDTQVKLPLQNRYENGNPPDIPPVDLSKVKFTSGYGMRMHPIKKVEMMHKGVDFAAAEGTEVYATADGKISETGFKEKSYGKFIMIRHDQEYQTFYTQLSDILVEPGQQVSKGDVIGKIGSTGLSTGPHLHYEVIRNGENVDPELYFVK